MRLATYKMLGRRRLSEVFDAEMIRYIAIRNAANIVDMSRIDKRPSVNDEDSFSWMAVGQVVRYGATANTRADYNVIEIRIRPIVVPNQTSVGLTSLGDEICIIVVENHGLIGWCDDCSPGLREPPAVLMVPAASLKGGIASWWCPVHWTGRLGISQ